jgi:acetyl esterase/lipase
LLFPRRQSPAQNLPDCAVAPGKNRRAARAAEETLGLVTDPTLTLFRAPAAKANGAAVLICPGGAYNILAWNKEGTEVAEWLNSLGVTAAVLKYRVPRRSKDTPPTFCAVTHDDQLRGVNAALFYIELKKAGVPAELHIYTKGGHGYGLRPSANPVSHWPQVRAEWLQAMELLTAKSGP